jgi:hypothetical protein
MLDRTKEEKEAAVKLTLSQLKQKNQLLFFFSFFQAHPRRALLPRPLRRRGVHPGRRAPYLAREEAPARSLRRLRALRADAHSPGSDEGPQRQQADAFGRDLQVLGR